MATMVRRRWSKKIAAKGRSLTGNGDGDGDVDLNITPVVALLPSCARHRDTETEIYEMVKYTPLKEKETSNAMTLK